jgi:cyclic-di-GMP-binding protein
MGAAVPLFMTGSLGYTWQNFPPFVDSLIPDQRHPIMPSFDTVLEPNLVELKNAVDQTTKEIGTRFDFKGSSARVELTEKSSKEREMMLHADSDFQIAQIIDVLVGKLSKRGVDVRFLDLSAKIEKAGGDKVRQPVTVKTGIDSENAKKIQTLIKQSKLKLQAQIQGDVVRISGAKRDELQAAIQLLKRSVTDLPLSFTNFRD